MIGLTQQDFLKLVIYRECLNGLIFPKAIFEKLKEDYPGKSHGKDYVYKTCRKLATVDETLRFVENSDARKTYYAITEKGKNDYADLIEKYEPKFRGVKKVIDRIVHDVSGNQPKLNEESEMKNDYRIFLSKLISVKDVIRYVALREMDKGNVQTMAEVGEWMGQHFGWIPSNSYLYKVEHEMEENGLAEGWWVGERRSKRIIRITEEGRFHFKQIANSLRERSLDSQRFLNHVLTLF